MTPSSIAFCVGLLLGAANSVQGFVPTARSISAQPTKAFHEDPITVLSATSDGEKDPRAYLRQSETRGVVLFTAVLLFNVWLFSIPPSFRRTEICIAPNAGSRADCSTVGEFFADVKTYYDNGGGVQFDFSIDPAKKQAFFSAFE